MIKSSKLEPANKRLWSAAASEARRRFPFDTIAASRFALPQHSIISFSVFGISLELGAWDLVFSA